MRLLPDSYCLIPTPYSLLLLNSQSKKRQERPLWPPGLFILGVCMTEQYVNPSPTGMFGLPYGAQALRSMSEIQKAIGQKGPVPNAVPAQGPGGNFGGGMEPSVFNAMILPQSGL